MKTYKIIYEIQVPTHRSYSIHANNEMEAIELGRKKLFESGHCQHELISLTRVTYDLKKERDETKQ